MRATKARTPDAPHVVMAGPGFGCMRCGEEQAVPWPVTIDMLKAMGGVFTKRHRRCKPSESGAARFRYSTPEEWLRSWDTGISSKTIFQALHGFSGLRHGEESVPQDAEDLGRCLRLLKALGWRARLPEVAKRYPAWALLVARWEELERLYEEELPSGRAPKTCALLAALRAMRAEGVDQ